MKLFSFAFFCALALSAVTLTSCSEEDAGIMGDIDVTGVTLSQTADTLTVGNTLTLIATVNPPDATDLTVAWTSSDTTVATVTNGLVTALKVGIANIIVTTTDGGKMDTCTITVSPIAAAGITLSQTADTLTVGDTLTLIATVNPPDATNPTVAWTSSDTTVATVTNGLVTTLKVGIANIIVTTTDGGKMDTCTITVAPIATAGITLSKTSDILTIGDTLTLTATVNPPNATDQAVTWSSSHPDVATVIDGLVTALTAGTANITATTADGEKTDTCMVTVVHQMTMTTENNDSIRFFVKGIGTATVDFGDGTTQDYILGDSYTTISHNYATAANYTVTFTGDITDLSFNDSHSYYIKGPITSLDVSKNTTLIHLDCNNNQLTSLDVSKNTALTSLNFSQNQLTSIDVSSNTALKNLTCHYNQLISLDVSNNKALTNLACSHNQLTSMDVSNNTALTNLTCSHNQLTSLDLSLHTGLTMIYCGHNQLTADALNALFGTLHSNIIAGYPRIYLFIAKNPGTATCNQSIAITKGWTVDTFTPL